MTKQEATECNHPSDRLYAWHAYDDTLVVCCCDCGECLEGSDDS